METMELGDLIVLVTDLTLDSEVDKRRTVTLLERSIGIVIEVINERWVSVFIQNDVISLVRDEFRVCSRVSEALG